MKKLVLIALLGAMANMAWGADMGNLNIFNHTSSEQLLTIRTRDGRFDMIKISPSESAQIKNPETLSEIRIRESW